MAWFVKNNPNKSNVHIPKYQALTVENINSGYASSVFRKA